MEVVGREGEYKMNKAVLFIYICLACFGVIVAAPVPDICKTTLTPDCAGKINQLSECKNLKKDGDFFFVPKECSEAIARAFNQCVPSACAVDKPSEDMVKAITRGDPIAVANLQGDGKARAEVLDMAANQEIVQLIAEEGAQG